MMLLEASGDKVISGLSLGYLPESGTGKVYFPGLGIGLVVIS